MRNPDSYRGARRNAARPKHGLRNWRAGPFFTITYNVKRWEMIRNAMNIFMRQFVDTTRVQTIHHTFALTMGLLKGKPA